jgi:hypothetical protein
MPRSTISSATACPSRSRIRYCTLSIRGFESPSRKPAAQPRSPVFEASWFGDALVVQPRYIALLVMELKEAGWSVS